MKYGILGTGDVAHTIGDKLIELGHSVMLGLRTADNPQAGVLPPDTWLCHRGKSGA